MPLFPQETTMEATAPERMVWTRENGTRNILLGFLVLVIGWLLVGKVTDFFLFQKKWDALTPEPQGLTVIGTLDSRGAYDRNLFKIVQVEGQARPEVTDFGWKTIFGPSRNWEKQLNWAGSDVSGFIESLIQQDGEAGYAILEPFLRAGVNEFMNKPSAFAEVTPNSQITLKGTQQKLGNALQQYYSKSIGKKDVELASTPEGGSGNEHQVEHGVVIPASTMINVCPIIVTSKHFTKAWYEEQPATVLGGKTYRLHLGLTDEGRSRFYQWSKDHVHESLLLVLNGEIKASGRIAFTMNVSEWEITNIKDEKAVKALEDWVNKN